MRSLIGTWPPTKDIGFSMLRALRMESLATQVNGHALRIAVGIGHHGRSSQLFTAALFEGEACCAMSDASLVFVGPDRKSAPMPETYRQRFATAPFAAAVPKLTLADDPIRQEIEHYPFRYELPTRYSDTDASGHLNNVALGRYLQNALLAWQGADRRVPTDFTACEHSLLAEANYPLPIVAGVRCQAVGAPGTELHSALFQGKHCVLLARHWLSAAPMP
jgi:acyl-CoA thioester hydrolase